MKKLVSVFMICLLVGACCNVAHALPDVKYKVSKTELSSFGYDHSDLIGQAVENTVATNENFSMIESSNLVTTKSIVILNKAYRFENYSKYRWCNYLKNKYSYIKQDKISIKFKNIASMRFRPDKLICSKCSLYLNYAKRHLSSKFEPPMVC